MSKICQHISTRRLFKIFKYLHKFAFFRGNYIAVSRKRSYEKTLWDKSEEEEIDLYDGKNKLKIKLAITEEEAFLLCHSEIKKEKEEAIFIRRMKSFEEGLREINGKLKKKKTQKKYEKVIERIGRLKEKYKVGNLYEIQIEKKEQNATNIKFTKNYNGKNKEETFGNYVLRTNRLDLSGEEISQIHRSLTRIEDCFKGMKAIGLRPNHHQTDKAMSGHINITVLGYHILCGVLKKLKTAQMHESWKSIRNILETHRRETITMNTQDNKVINIRSCTTPSEKQYKIYYALDIKQTPIKKIKTKISIKKNKNSGIKNRDLSTTQKCSDENEITKFITY